MVNSALPHAAVVMRLLLALLLASAPLQRSATSLHPPTLPPSTISRSVAAARASWERLCASSQCAAASRAVTQVELHQQNETAPLFVLDWTGWLGSGLGDVLSRYYLRPLAACALSGRACYVRRNEPSCGIRGSVCYFQPGDYLGTRDGAEWRWTAEREARLRAAGVRETVLTLRANLSGFDGPDGLLISAGNVAAVLLDPRVASLPWLTVRAEADGLHSGSALDTLSGWSLAEAISRALASAQPPHCDASLSLRCLEAAFTEPLPELHAALSPHLAALDAALAAGEASVGVHLRSGYADYATRPDDLFIDEPVPLGYWSSESGGGSSGTTSDDSVAARWQSLESSFRGCQDSEPGHCVVWDAASDAALHSWGRSCAPDRDDGAGHSPLIHNLRAEVGGGRLAAALACAVAAAGSGAVRPYIYVAGDLPPFCALANRTRALARTVHVSAGELGHVAYHRVCRGRSRSRHLDCKNSPEGDPGGAWLRALVDMYMLGAVDTLVRVGAPSSFTLGAVRARRVWAQRDLPLLWHASHTLGDEALAIDADLGWLGQMGRAVERDAAFWAPEARGDDEL